MGRQAPRPGPKLQKFVVVLQAWARGDAAEAEEEAAAVAERPGGLTARGHGGYYPE